MLNTGARLGAMVMALAMLIVGAGPSYADNGPFTDTVPLNLVVSDGNGSSETSIPVLPGLIPTSLSATITATGGASAPAGTYTLLAGESAASVDTLTGGPVTIPLTSESVKDGLILVRLTSQILDPNGCAYDSPTNTTTGSVKSATITYAGSPNAPVTVSEFFSEAVKSIGLISAPDAVAFTAPAVLQAAASLGTAYTKAAISTSEPAPGPYARIVRFVPTTGPVVATIQTGTATPTMTLSGDPAAMVAAARALGSSSVALASSGTTTSMQENGQAPDSLNLTWADLGSQSPSLSGIGTMTAVVSVPQARFGQPISQLAITINGRHVPTPSGTNTTASLLVNDRLLASTLLTDNDTFTLSGTVGPDSISRSNRVSVQVQSVLTSGDCRATFIPARVDIDAKASTFTATAGQSLAPGFERFPQVLKHQLPVAFAKAPTPIDLSNAVTIVASMSRLEYAPLTVTVPAAADFLNSSQPGLLINAGPEESTALGAPLPFDPTRAPVTNPPTFSVAVAEPFAAIEAFQSGERDVLMLGAYPAQAPDRAQALQNELTAAIAPAPDGFYEMTGDVFFAGGAVKPASINFDTPTTPSAAAESGSGTPAWLIALGLLLLLLVAAAIAAWLLRRRRPGSTPENDANPVDAAASDQE